MKRNCSPFKWRHYAPDVILLCVGWYCRYQLSYRDLEEMMRERGLSVDHVTIFRWVRRYAPEINKRMRPRLKMSGTSYRLDETYVEVIEQDGCVAKIDLRRGRPRIVRRLSGHPSVRSEPARCSRSILLTKAALTPNSAATCGMVRSPRRAAASTRCRESSE